MSNSKVFTGLLLSLGALLPMQALSAVETPIQFRHGSHRLVVSGTLSTHHSSHAYRLTAHAGTRLKIGVTTSGGINGIVAMYHIVFPSGKTFGEKGYDPFDGKLTETGRYHIVVEVNQMASNASHGRYRLTLQR
jgi:hypothetical protein